MMRLREAMATDESFVDPFWICTNLGFVQTDATLEKTYGYLSALKSGVPPQIQQQINSSSTAVDSVDILYFPMMAIPNPKGSLKNQLCKGNLQCCFFFPSSFSGIQSGPFVFFSQRFKKTVLKTGRGKELPTFWREVVPHQWMKKCSWRGVYNWNLPFFFLNSLNERPSASQLFEQKPPFTIGFNVKVGDIKWHDLKFDPTQKMVGSLVVTGSSRAQINLVPQLWEWAIWITFEKNKWKKEGFFCVEKVLRWPF